MDKLEKLVEVKLKANPEVENVRCCNCCSIKKDKTTNNKKCCECCTRAVILERAINKPAKTFKRWFSK